MIGSIAILKNLRTLSVLNHFNLRYLNNSNKLTNQTINQEEKIRLREQSIWSRRQSTESNANLNDLILSLGGCKNLNDLLDLFDLIEPHKLTNEHLKIIIDSIVNSFKHFKIEVNPITLTEFSKLMKRSNAFQSILNQINQQNINKSDDKLLSSLIQTFFLIKQAPESEIVSHTFNELKTRLNNVNLDLNALLDYLVCMNNYMFSNVNAINQYLNLYQTCLNVCKYRVLGDEFDFNQHTIIKLYSIFLSAENDLDQQIINHLNQKLFSTDFVFDFKGSVKLLKKIMDADYKLSRLNRNKIKNLQLRSIYDEVELKRRDKQYFAKSLNLLIQKLNDQVYETFRRQLDERQLDFYLLNVHGAAVKLNSEFVNFYDKRLFQLLLDHLIENYQTSPKCKELICNLAKNYAKFSINDERLMRLIYHLFCTDKQFRCDKYLYFFLSKYRLPFVDHNFIAKLIVYHTTESFETNKKEYLNLLVEFILNDVVDGDLFNYLIKKIGLNHLDNRSLVLENSNFFKKLLLAKTYVTLFSNDLDEKLKKSIELKLDEYIFKFDSMQLTMFISFKTLVINKKLQINGYYAYQSNRIYLNEFAIYDQTRKDLISLDSYRDLFKKIDQIPLNKDQKL